MCEANSFLAGAAWNGLGCYVHCPLAAGRHRWAALVVRGVVGFWLRLMARGSLAHRPMCEAFFPSRGKEPKGDRWQPIRDSTMAAPGPLLAWVEGETSCGARLIPSSRGRLGATLGAVPVVRRRSGGTSGPPSLRARWWAFGCACWARGSFAHRRMCGGVLSLSRERTKGRPGAANPRQRHGCPRAPRRLA